MIWRVVFETGASGSLVVRRWWSRGREGKKSGRRTRLGLSGL